MGPLCGRRAHGVLAARETGLDSGQRGRSPGWIKAVGLFTVGGCNDWELRCGGVVGWGPVSRDVGLVPLLSSRLLA